MKYTKEIEKQRQESLSANKSKVAKIREMRKSVPHKRFKYIQKKLSKIIKKKQDRITNEKVEVRRKKGILKNLLKKEKNFSMKLLQLEGDLVGESVIPSQNIQKVSPLLYLRKHRPLSSGTSIPKNKSFKKLPKFEVSYSKYYMDRNILGFKDFVEFKSDLKDWKRRKRMLRRYSTAMGYFVDGSMDHLLNQASVSISAQEFGSF